MFCKVAYLMALHLEMHIPFTLPTKHHRKPIPTQTLPTFTLHRVSAPIGAPMNRLYTVVYLMTLDLEMDIPFTLPTKHHPKPIPTQTLKIQRVGTGI